MNTCYQLFNALARGWRAPRTQFIVAELQGTMPSYRVMPIYDHMKKDPVKHDSLKERIKGLKRRLRGNPLDATARANLQTYQTELDLRRSGNPTDFHV